MKKSSIVLIVIVILLAIALGLMTWYMFYWRNGYLQAATTMYEYVKTLEDAGVSVISNENNETFVVLEDENNVVMESELSS